MDDRVDDGPAKLGLDLGERRPKIVFGEPPVQRCPPWTPAIGRRHSEDIGGDPLAATAA
jgi:hypothetical protein